MFRFCYLFFSKRFCDRISIQYLWYIWMICRNFTFVNILYSHAFFKLFLLNFNVLWILWHTITYLLCYVNGHCKTLIHCDWSQQTCHETVLFNFLYFHGKYVCNCLSAVLQWDFECNFYSVIFLCFLDWFGASVMLWFAAPLLVWTDNMFLTCKYASYFWF